MSISVVSIVMLFLSTPLAKQTFSIRSGSAIFLSSILPPWCTLLPYMAIEVHKCFKLSGLPFCQLEVTKYLTNFTVNIDNMSHLSQM
jgi:hypothetical protein